MKQKLRLWILLVICITTLWWGGGCQQVSSKVDDSLGRHVVERLSFGATSREIKQVQSRGIENYIQSQLNPQPIESSSPLGQDMARLELMQKSPLELFKTFVTNRRQIQQSGLSNAEVAQLQQQNRNYQQRIKDQTIAARLLRAINSPNQLQEVMVDFWFNHFNVYADKKVVSFWLADYENELRTQALGNFRDLLGVTAHHPAMLIYLDNELNTAPQSPKKRGQFQGLNENYARELMELHTLGADGGYTQADVVALARIFTGWGVDRWSDKGDENGFFFAPNRHDRTDKIFLGQKIIGGGIEEGEQALDILAAHPATAHFISYKLAQYFVADEPPKSLVDLLTQKFLESQGNIKEVLNTLIHSNEFNDPQLLAQKFKTPYQYLVSLVRSSEISEPDFKRIQGMLHQLGMSLYNCPTPNGYQNTQDVWLNPDGILRRVSLATAIARGAVTDKNPVDSDKLSQNLQDRLSATTKAAIAKNPPKLKAALMLGSPELMYR